jgi:hypothetical protein
MIRIVVDVAIRCLRKPPAICLRTAEKAASSTVQFNRTVTRNQAIDLPFVRDLFGLLPRTHCGLDRVDLAGDDVNRSGAADPSPTILMRSARYDKLIEAFGGTGYHVTDPQCLTKALAEAVASGKPAIINCVIDPTAGTESGHLQSLNPTSQIDSGRK